VYIRSARLERHESAVDSQRAALGASSFCSAMSAAAIRPAMIAAIDEGD
jgi:hypothetical protein